MDRLSRDPRFRKVVVFEIDSDSSKELLRRWKVGQQSTLLDFKGKTETLLDGRHRSGGYPEDLRGVAIVA